MIPSQKKKRISHEAVIHNRKKNAVEENEWCNATKTKKKQEEAKKKGESQGRRGRTLNWYNTETKSKAKKQYRAWKSKSSPKGTEEKEQGHELTEEGKELQTPNWSSQRRRSLKKTKYRWKMKAMPPGKLTEAMWRGMDAAPAGRRAR
jgi:hypothetical protein